MTTRNTLSAAYLKALDVGAEGPRVRCPADGRTLVTSSVSTTATCAGRRPTRASSRPWKPADLDQLDFASWKNPWAELDDEVEDRDIVAEPGADPARKLLETVADYDRRVELAIETKHPTRYGGLVERRLIDLLRRVRMAPQRKPRPRIMSFSLTALQRARNRLAPDLEYVMLVEKARHWRMLKPARRSRTGSSARGSVS